jgi:hypothetical protein
MQLVDLLLKAVENFHKIHDLLSPPAHFLMKKFLLITFRLHSFRRATEIGRPAPSSEWKSYSQISYLL